MSKKKENDENIKKEQPQEEVQEAEKTEQAFEDYAEPEDIPEE